ncbi:MAG: Cobalt-zinc-cadmium resistance protein CzcA [Turneriella sp.]|nr:Cobalt-zinc-cadmium resistance protein CzcA [Turneriella sp.]
MRNLYAAIVSRPLPILFFSLFIASVGVVVFLTMPRSLFPEVNYPRVVVDVNMGFAPLQIMEWGVTSVLEKELRAVPGVRIVKSSTSRGISSIHVFLRENENVTQAIQRVNAKIAEVRSLIPPTAQISIRPITAEAFAGAEYCFVSEKLSPQELRTFVEFTLKPLVLVQPGIFNSKVLGGELPEFRVLLDTKKLSSYNLTVADIDDRVRNSNVLDFIGPVNQSGVELLAFGGQLAWNKRDIEDIVIASSLGSAVRVKDLGRVELGNAWKYKDLALNGKECVSLQVFYQSGIDQQITSRAVQKIIRETTTDKTKAITYRNWDLNDFTDTATTAVLIDLALGMLIIGLVTFLFLGNLRHSLFALISMPLAATFTFLAMKGLHLSINLMTLGGLSAAIGLVVDNTVILLEMLHQKRHEHPELSTPQVLVESLSAISKPMILGTLTIALVFTPIGFLSGISGMFFEPMAHVHGASLMISLLLAVFCVPALILLADHKKHVHANPLIKQEHLNKPYRFALGGFLKRPGLTALLSMLIPVIAIIILPFVKTGFLPEWDEGDMVIDYRAVKPLGLKATVAELKPLEEYLGKIPEVDFFIRKTGSSLGRFDKQPYMGEIVVKLKKHRKRSVFAIRQEISEHATKLLPELELDFFQILPDRLNDLSGSNKPIVLYLRGDSDEKLDQASEHYKNLLAKIPGLESVRIDEPPNSPEVLFVVNEERSRAIEINPNIMTQNARFALFSLDSGSVQRGPQTIPIRLSMQKRDASQSNIADLPIHTLKGGLSRLGAFGRVKEVPAKVESNHIDGNPVRSITGELAHRDLGSVVRDIQKTLAANPQEGIYVTLAGEYETQQQSFRELVLAFFTGIVLIFLTSIFLSNRFATAFSLTLSALIPPSVGLIGLGIFGIALDVSSFSGLISVTGIAVANGFMAWVAIEGISTGKGNYASAVLAGMQSRVRPILMTNLAAMAGFIPIAIGLAEGDEILRPFSIAVIIGLFGSMFTTLFVMPAFFRIFIPNQKV